MFNTKSIYNLCTLFYKKAQSDHESYWDFNSVSPNQENEDDDIPTIPIQKPEKILEKHDEGETDPELIDPKSEDVVSSTLGHNDYLITVIDNFNTMYESVPTKIMNQFVENNIDKINRLRSFFGVAKPIYLGGGADGIVFDIGNGLVVKFLTDRFSVEKAQEAMDSIFQGSSTAKTEAMTHHIGQIGVTPGSQNIVYYIIMEKMNPITNLRRQDSEVYGDIKYLASAVIGEVDGIFSREVWGHQGSGIDHLKFERGGKLKEKYLKDHIANVISQCKSSFAIAEAIASVNDAIKAGIVDLRDDWFERFVEEIFDKVATERGDLHMGNLGITGYGTLCFYDPAHRYWTTRINYR